MHKSLFLLAAVGVFATACGSAEVTVEASVQALARDARVLQAFDRLDERRDDTNGAMVALNQVAAPPFGEAARGRLYARLMAQAGLTVTVDEAGNVIGRLAGQDPERAGTLALVAHLDTVFPASTDVRVQRDGPIYRGPGIGDNARALAMLLALADAMTTASLSVTGDVLFIGSVGEEGLGDLRGMRHLFGDHADAPSIDTVIAVDGGDLARVVNTAVGSHRYKVTFKGPGGHSYGNFGEAHPHQALAAAIDNFRRAAQVIVSRDGPKATFSVGRIGGGTSINSIPFESWMEVDMRSADPERLRQLDQAFRRAVDDALVSENSRRKGGSALSVDIESVGLRPAGTTPDDSPLVRTALAALEQVGVTGSLSASSTDANIPMSIGVPAITVSRGGISRHAHSLAEEWEDRNTARAERAVLLMTLAIAGLADEPVAAD